MNYVYIPLLLTMTLLFAWREKNIFNPGTLFCGIWTLVMLFSSLQLNGLVATSDRAYSIAFAGIVCFAIGCMVRNRVRFKEISWLTPQRNAEVEINYTLLILIYTVVLAFTVAMASRSIPLLLSGVSMNTIRFNYSNIEAGLVINSTLLYSIEVYLVQTTEFAAVVLLPIVLTDKNSVKKFILLFELAAFLVLHIFVTGARSFLIDVAILLVLYMLINKQYRARFRRYFNRIPKLILVLVGIGAIYVVIAMTQMRKGDALSITEEIYQYFAIPFPLLDIKLGIMDKTQNFTNGLTLLNGLLRPVFLLGRILGIKFPQAYAAATDLIADNNIFYYVGSGRANSFVTLFYYFYMDFGILSVILGCFAYGYFSQSMYKAMKRKPDRRRQALYLLTAIGLILSFVRLFFSALRYVYAFALILIAFRRQRTKSGRTS